MDAPSSADHFICLGVLSVSQLIRYIPARKRILFERLNWLHGTEPFCCQSTTNVSCVLDHKSVTDIVCLERLHELVRWLLVVSARDRNSRLLAHRDHACVRVANPP